MIENLNWLEAIDRAPAELLEAPSILTVAPKLPKRSKERGGFARVDILALASILDGKTEKGKGSAKDSAAAAHLLAIKAAMPDGKNTLNNRYCQKVFKLSHRRFKAGMRMLRNRRVLERRQEGRGFATETLLIRHTVGGFIPFPSNKLGLPSPVVGFALATMISPEPKSALDVAKRIGVRSPKTAALLAQSAAEHGLVAMCRGSRREIWVGRNGTDFAQINDLGKNVPAKNDPAKNVPTHLDGRVQLEERQHLEENNTRYGYASQRSAPPEKDWIVLTDWRRSVDLDFFDLSAEFDETPVLNFDAWCWYLDKFGPVPGHLYQVSAFFQATQIAHAVKTTAGDFVPRNFALEAMIALAAMIGDAARNGRQIRSLGFLAKRLLHAVYDGHFQLILNRRSFLANDQLRLVTRIAADAVERFEASGVPIDADALLSSSQIEQLAAHVERFGAKRVDTALASAAGKRHGPSTGKVVNGWIFWAGAWQ